MDARRRAANAGDALGVISRERAMTTHIVVSDNDVELE
jgi:hypothetical protein